MKRSLPLVLSLVCAAVAVAGAGGRGGIGEGIGEPATELRAALQVGTSSLLSGRQWWHLMAGAAAPRSLAAAIGHTGGDCRDAGAAPISSPGRGGVAGRDLAAWRDAMQAAAGRVRADAALRRPPARATRPAR